MEWVKLCGPSEMTFEIVDFLRDEVELRNRTTSEIHIWRNILLEMFNNMLINGMPMMERFSHREETRRAINAEKSLLLALNACAMQGKSVCEVEWPEQNSAKAFLLRASSQGGGSFLINSALSFLNFQRCDLSSMDLRYANFQMTNLNNVNFDDSNLEYSDLRGMTIDQPNIRGTSFIGANLTDVTLKSATLGGTQFQGAILEDCNLQFGETIVSRTFGGRLFTENKYNEIALVSGFFREYACTRNTIFKNTGTLILRVPNKKTPLYANFNPPLWKGKN